MRKFVTTIFATIAGLALTGQVFAASANVDIRIQQPKSPTNTNSLKVNFVSLDRMGRSITVQCFKKGPTDGSFVQFGSDITLAAGGSTNYCEPSTILSPEGTYQFYAVATAGSDSATSTTVTVDYNTTGPGTPTNYSKDLPSSCTYKIKVHTASDAGETVRVDLYRSDVTSFTADVAHRVDQRFVGSNTDVEILNTVPDCAKTYYYAVRAFDSAANGSGIVGDSVTTITTTSTGTTTTTTTTNGAASGATGSTNSAQGQGAVAGGTNGNVLGTSPETPTPETTPEPGSVKGESTTAEKINVTDDTGFLDTVKVPLFVALGLGAILVIAWLLKNRKKPETLV